MMRRVCRARLPEPRPFEQDSALFASINESYTEGFVEVYAPGFLVRADPAIEVVESPQAADP